MAPRKLAILTTLAVAALLAGCAGDSTPDQATPGDEDAGLSQDVVITDPDGNETPDSNHTTNNETPESNATSDDQPPESPA